MKKNIFVILFLVFFLIPVSFIFNNFISNEKESESLSNSFPISENKEIKSHRINKTWYGESDAIKKEKLERWGKKANSIPDAARLAMYNAKVPSESLKREIIGIYVGEAPVGEKPAVTILFNNGLHINQRKDNVKPDYNKLLEEMEQHKKDGIYLADSLPKLIEINGNKGLAYEPGYNNINGEKEPRPGVITWYEDGTYYEIYGENINTNDLLQVAKSLK